MLNASVKFECNILRCCLKMALPTDRPDRHLSYAKCSEIPFHRESRKNKYTRPTAWYAKEQIRVVTKQCLHYTCIMEILKILTAAGDKF